MNAEEALRGLFADYPEVLYGFTDISYSVFAGEYRSALVFAVPYDPQLTTGDYTEDSFENGIQTAKAKLEGILSRIETLLRRYGLKYYVPPVAQRDETELLAPFSFKYAAVNAGLGWIGKNDVVITARYGPRVRLSAVLIDSVFAYGEKMTRSACPEGCLRCVEACPCKALHGTMWDISSKREDIIDFRRCNRMRSAFIPKLGRKSACGLCMAACPVGSPGGVDGGPAGIPSE